MPIQIKKQSGVITIVCFVLILAIGNASLRFIQNGMSSFFRLISPCIVLGLLLLNADKYTKLLAAFLLTVSYNIAVSLFFYNYINIEFYVFLAYMFIVLLLVKTYQIYSENFENDFFVFLDIVTVITLLLASVQYFVRIPYPFVRLPAKRGMNLFMSNENELAEPLGCMLLIYAYRLIFKKEKSHAWKILAIIAITFINDSKLTILGYVIGLLGLLLYRNAREQKRSARKLRPRISGMMRTEMVLAVLILGIASLYIANPFLKFRDYDISIRDLIFQPILNIVRLEKMPGRGGSLVDRTNAVIFGVRELISSYFFGIGLGNSVVMLTKPEYTLLTAKSMHNLVFQILTEMGYLGMYMYYRIFKWFKLNLHNVNCDNSIILKLVFAISFVLISSQSSIGIMSNYYTCIVVYYILLIPSAKIDCNLKK